MHPFGQPEYERRVERTKRAMADRGLEALVVSDAANINYLSGYDGWSFYVPQYLVLLADRDDPVWLGREMDAVGARRTTWLAESDIRTYGAEYVQSSVHHPMSVAIEVLDDLGYDGGPIGVELDGYNFSGRNYKLLRDRVGDEPIRDATFLVREVRLVKSDAELEFMRAAGEVVTNAMATARETLDAGVRECDVIAEVYRTLIRGTEEYAGDYPAMNPAMSSGENSNVPHFTWSDRTLAAGDGVTLEIAGCVNHYNAPLARTFYLGSAPEKATRTAEAMVEGLDAVIDAVEPGITAADAERAWRESIEGSFLTRSGGVTLKGGKSRIGYACGLGYPPDWGEHTVSFQQGDDTVLEPNMTFHVFPAVRYDDFGVEISETIRVTPTGAEPLARVPRELLVV